MADGRRPKKNAWKCGHSTLVQEFLRVVPTPRTATDRAERRSDDAAATQLFFRNTLR